MTGEVPDWYELVGAARWLGVPPWELAERPSAWRAMALAAAKAEHHAATARK